MHNRDLLLLTAVLTLALFMAGAAAFNILISCLILLLSVGDLQYYDIFRFISSLPRVLL